MQQNKQLTPYHNFSWTFIGNAVYVACQWGVIIALAKLGSAVMVGQFALGIAVINPVFMLANLQLRSVQVTENKKQYCFSDYLGLRLISGALALLVITGISSLAQHRWETSLVIFLLGIAKVLDSISDLFYGLIQQHKRQEKIAISLMTKGLLSLLLVFLGVSGFGSVLWGVMGLVFAGVLVLIGYDIPNGVYLLQDRFKVQPRWCGKTLIQLVVLCLPLGLMTMLISLNINIPRYFIVQYLGEQALGIFAAIAYLMVVGGILVSALGESSIAKLVKYYEEKNISNFRILLLKLIGMATLFSGVATLVAVLLGKQILTLLYGYQYGEQSQVLVWLMVAAGISYISSFLGYGMTAAKHFFMQIFVLLAVVMILSIACSWLIPQLGLVGAAIALILAATVQAVLSWVAILYSGNGK